MASRDIDRSVGYLCPGGKIVKIDNGTGGSRETSTGKPERVGERGRESINLFAELKQRNIYKVVGRMKTNVSEWNRLVKGPVSR